MKQETQQAITIFKQGGIVIFPTDTAFGIGCRVDDEKAVSRLFKIRNRPETKATPVLVSSLKMAEKYLRPIPKDVIDQLVNLYWPGAITIVMPCLTEKIPILVRGGGKTIGVRMPNHEIMLQVISGVSVPVLGPSANFAGGETPYEFEDLDKELIKLVDFVLPGECTVKQTSTVIDCSVNPWEIRRQGAVKLGTTIIIIDTTSNQQIKVGLVINGKEYLTEQLLDHQKAQVVLPLIDKLLKEHNLNLSDIQGIRVNPGTGSFTGVRVGLTIANTLGFLLRIPINNKRVGDLVEPVYTR